MKSVAVPDYLPIADAKSLSRHTGSMAVVNTDSGAQTRYRQNRDRILADKRALVEANVEILNLRKEMRELRELVQQCVLRQLGAETT